MKIFVENSALFYYEKSKVYSKETISQLIRMGVELQMKQQANQ